MDDSAIMYDKVLESYNKETKTIPSFNEKKAICKTQNFHILLAFFIKYYNIIDSCQYLLLFDKIQGKKHLTPVQDTKNELSEVLYK